ncbi:MAG: hypothetical protein M5T52_10835 [Ignavibacteriaceae bacterium]|nr:hypothetical protein [Ignavibacteriaceae bacterium]
MPSEATTSITRIRGLITSRVATYPLKAFAPKNNVMFPIRWTIRKIIRKLPVTAIINFLPIEELRKIVTELMHRLLLHPLLNEFKIEEIKKLFGSYNHGEIML